MARTAASQRKTKADRARRLAGSRAAAARPKRHRLRASPRLKNPLLEPWTAAFELPPFDRLASQHFLPAFDRALADHLKELAAIAGQRGAPTFQNTIEALERSGRALDRVASVFFNLSGTDTSPEIQEIERKVAPRLAKHNMRVYQDARLFKRVAALVEGQGGLRLSEEQVRVLERYHRAFVKAELR